MGYRTNGSGIFGFAKVEARMRETTITLTQLSRQIDENSM